MNSLNNQNLCLYCQTPTKNKYCSRSCEQTYRKVINVKDKDKKVQCQICKVMYSHNLTSHITRKHKMSCLDYQKNYKSPIISNEYFKNSSDRVKGDKNPAFNHGGKFSSLSKNFIYADKVNTEEIKKKIGDSNKTNGNCKLTVKYWLNKGYTEEEAKDIISKNQSTFSKEKCIEKYGEEKGLQVWKERQEKWQKTLNSKCPEEIERISKAKMCNGRGYSIISQSLFQKIKNNIDPLEKVYFATLDCKTNKILDHKQVRSNNNEYFYISLDKKDKFFFDFYMPSKKKIIEFYGDYWHGEKRGNKTRDEARINKLNSDGFKVFIILEKDYRANPEQTVKKCLEYLNG